MKAQRKPMAMWQKILYFFSFVILIWAFIYLGTRDYHVHDQTDAELFSQEYPNVGENNSFHYLSSYETLEFLNQQSGLLFLGFSENEWSGWVAEFLQKASLQCDYMPIYYYDFSLDRVYHHDHYMMIVQKLKEYAVQDDMGNVELYAPTVIGVLNGKIVYFDSETNFVPGNMTPSDYWTKEKKDEKIQDYVQVIQKIKKEE